MAQITDIQPQKRKKDRVNIYLNDEYAFSLAQISAAYLQIGQEITAEKIAALRLEDEYERAKDAALRLIVQRPRSTHEVQTRLKQKEFAAETIEKVCLRLTELEMLDDRTFARYWVEQRNNFKPRSPMALRQELGQKGIAREIINEAVTQIDPEKSARRAALKQVSRWQTLPKDAFEKKLSGYLQRRGFSFGIIKKITSEMWEQTPTFLEGE
jgi:regulatory protein